MLLVEYERGEVEWLYSRSTCFMQGLMLAVPIQVIRSKELILGNTVITLVFLWLHLRQKALFLPNRIYLQLNLVIWYMIFLLSFTCAVWKVVAKPSIINHFDVALSVTIYMLHGSSERVLVTVVQLSRGSSGKILATASKIVSSLVNLGFHLLHKR